MSQGSLWLSGPLPLGWKGVRANGDPSVWSSPACMRNTDQPDRAQKLRVTAVSLPASP